MAGYIKVAKQTCYACEKAATTREHVPPLCFFPSDQRSGLITVPSCNRHNNENSRDVEYVRDVLVSLAELGPESKEVFAKALRSFDRRPSLIPRVYADLRLMMLRGQERGIFTIDLPRIDRIMIAIARALCYRDSARKHKKWKVFMVTAQSDESLGAGRDAWEPLRRQLAILRYEYPSTAQPTVFAYGKALLKPNAVVYQLLFYDAVVINVWMEK